jgi:predicted nucleotidyltransferase
MYPKRNNQLEIMSLFRTNYKNKLYFREISRLSKLSLKACQNALANLEDGKILKSSVEGKNKYFCLNLDSIRTKLWLLQSEIYQTDKFLEKHTQFKTFLKSTNSSTPIIVFGSFASFSAKKDSDLDVLIISKKEPVLPFHLMPFEIHKITLTETTFLKALNKQEDLIKEIEECHIILNNHSFYVDVMWGIYGK